MATLPPLVSQLGPAGIMLLLLTGVFWALVTGKLVPKSQLDYREALADKATAAAENWRSLHGDEVRRNDLLMGIVSDIVGEETATTRLINTLREKAEDAPSLEGTS